MITTVIANTLPYPEKTGGIWRLPISTASIPSSIQEAVNNFCYCGFECEFQEYAFADIDDNRPYKNDSSAFLFRKVSALDSITFALHKNGVQIALLNSNTYGTLFSGFANQPLYTGFLLSWRAVLATFGAGKYNFVASLNILGNTTTYTSRSFRLLPYADDLANGTVKIESWQNGNIIGSEFDFTGLNWYSSYRIAGKFGNKTPILEVDNYTTADYVKAQIQDRIRTEYTLQTKLLPSVVANALAYDQVLANRILLTDYNLFNHEFYRQVEVRPISIDSQSYEQNRGISFAVKFEAVTDLRKRNF